MVDVGGPYANTIADSPPQVMIYAFSVFTIFTMACALAPNYPAFIVFRFLGGIAASCPITVVGG